MAGGGKQPRKFGGVKTASRDTPASSSPKKQGRTFGVVKAPERGNDIIEPMSRVRAALRRHAAQVESVVKDILRESDSTPAHYPSVLWRQDGHGKQDWQCPHRCNPVALASGWSHAQDCPHWLLAGADIEREAIQSEGAAEGGGDNLSGLLAQEDDDLPF